MTESTLLLAGEAWRSILSALLIGLLVGAQREAAHRSEAKAGLRDFVAIAVAGSVTGLLQVALLSAAALVAVAALLVFFHERDAADLGMTTELAAIAVFCLAHLTSVPGLTDGRPVAIALTVVLALFLEAKRGLHRFFRETVTEVEFNDTLWFLALIFVIYPLLPVGDFGPYGFFRPRQVWFFVILVSSVSYVGYFLEKFLGAGIGLKLTGVLGGLASSTAATTAFAKDVRAEPTRQKEYWQAVTLANAIQFPRILVVVAAFSVQLAGIALLPFAGATAAGLLLAVSLRPEAGREGGRHHAMNLRNPFTIGPALKFGAVFAIVILIGKAAAHHFGAGALPVTAAIGGLLDVDAIAVSSAQGFASGKIGSQPAVASLLIALVMNAAFKTFVAFSAGTRAFALRVGVSFAVMLGAGAAFLVALG